MSVCLVTFILRDLVIYYKMNEAQEKQLYAHKHILDKALKNICNLLQTPTEKSLLKEAVSQIDSSFYALIDDDATRVQLFVCRLIKRHCDTAKNF